jgi:hypothetical protein
MISAESPVVVLAQALVAVAVIAGATLLAYLDPTSRGLLEGVLAAGAVSAITWFFSQRTQAGTAHLVTNSMATMSTQIASATPGPAGPSGEPGATGPPGPSH